MEKGLTVRETGNTVVVACRILEAELKAAMAETGRDYPVVWMESGLHEQPKKLTEALKEALARTEADYRPDTVLLGYGFCGNALAGIRPGQYRLILPRIDDCITMFIGSRERKRRLENGVGTLFLTEGWLQNDMDILTLRQGFIDDYGEEDGLDIFNMMYGNYRRIGLLDCGCCPLAPQAEKSRAIARALGFEHEIDDCSIDYLKELLTGPWPEERFLVKQPGQVIETRELQI